MLSSVLDTEVAEEPQSKPTMPSISIVETEGEEGALGKLKP